MKKTSTHSTTKSGSAIGLAKQTIRQLRVESGVKAGLGGSGVHTCFLNHCNQNN